MEWTEVASQALPALAALLGGVVTGGFQYLNHRGDRKHERRLKNDDYEREEKRISQERDYGHIERQEEAVKNFLQTVREQQNAVAEVRNSFSRNRKIPGPPDIFESVEEEETIWAVAFSGRHKAIQAWDMLELVATNDDLKKASTAIGRALREETPYSLTDIFPLLEGVTSFPPREFEDLLGDLREATAKIRLATDVEKQEDEDT